MMSSNADQARQILIFFGCGGVCGIVSALRRCIAAYTHPSPLRRFTGDCLFCVAALVIMFLVSLSVSAGELRMTTALIATVGYAVMKAASQPLLHLIFRCIHRILSAVICLIRRLTRPIAEIVRVFCKKLRFFCKKGLRYKYVMLYNDDE